MTSSELKSDKNFEDLDESYLDNLLDNYFDEYNSLIYNDNNKTVTSANKTEYYFIDFKIFDDCLTGEPAKILKEERLKISNQSVDAVTLRKRLEARCIKEEKS